MADAEHILTENGEIIEFPAPIVQEEEEGRIPIILQEIEEVEELTVQTRLLGEILSALGTVNNRLQIIQRETVETFKEELSGSIFWPRDGGTGLLPAGKTDINLKDGTINLPNATEDLSADLTDFPVNVFQSVHFTPFVGRMAVEIQPPSGVPGYRGDQFFLDRRTHTIRHAPIQELSIWTQFPGAVQIQFGANPNAPTLTPSGVQGPAEWFASITTQDSYQPLVMRPVSVNPRNQTRTAMSEADAKANAILNAEAVEVPFSREQTWILRNTGDNDAEVRLEGASKPETDAFNPDKATGDSVTIPAGDAKTFNIDTFYQFMRAQARSAASGQQTTVEADFMALGGV